MTNAPCSLQKEQAHYNKKMLQSNLSKLIENNPLRFFVTQHILIFSLTFFCVTELKNYIQKRQKPMTKPVQKQVSSSR